MNQLSFNILKKKVKIFEGIQKNFYVIYKVDIHNFFAVTLTTKITKDRIKQK